MSRILDEADYAGIKNLFESSIEEMRLEQDRVSGDYNVFWDERNYLNNVYKMTASLFIVHGLNATATIQNNISMEFEGFDSWPVTSQSIKLSLDGGK